MKRNTLIHIIIEISVSDANEKIGKYLDEINTLDGDAQTTCQTLITEARQILVTLTTVITPRKRTLDEVLKEIDELVESNRLIKTDKHYFKP